MIKVGTRLQVMRGTAKQTGGGLKKKDLKYNKHGKIVSKKISNKIMKGGMRGESTIVYIDGIIYNLVKIKSYSISASAEWVTSNELFACVIQNIDATLTANIIEKHEDNYTIIHKQENKTTLQDLPNRSRTLKMPFPRQNRVNIKDLEQNTLRLEFSDQDNKDEFLRITRIVM